MERRTFLISASLAGTGALVSARTTRARHGRIDAGAQAAALDRNREYSIAELGTLMSKGEATAAGVTRYYLERIETIDRSGPAVNSVIELNPDALMIAEALDRERAQGKVRGPLHGIPILLKDNIDSADRMRTSAGSLALAESTPERDAFIVERLRAAGAVLLGKTNLSEWANFRSMRSTSGWSARGGLTRNPYVLDRNACGSSSGSGVAVAAHLCVGAVGTETDGSIVCPSTVNGIVGLKPTVGLLSRAGIIPISASQDTAGPMTRSVADAALMLSAMTGVDPRDPATAASRRRLVADYASGLASGGLKGARLGIMRNFFGFHDGVDRLMAEALAVLTDAGAVLVDPADLPTKGKFEEEEFQVMLYEFKDGLDKYLGALPAAVRTRSLKDVIAFNTEHATREMPWFGQELFEKAASLGPLTTPAYRKARDLCVRLSRRDGIDAVMTRHRLDALIAPTGAPAWTTDLVNGDHYVGGSSSPAAVSGYPNVTVPAGLVTGLPVGVSFIGRAWSEAALLRYAYAFEQASKRRERPRFLTTIAV
jgi:amidase